MKNGDIVRWAQLLYAVFAAASFLFAGAMLDTGGMVPMSLGSMAVGIFFLWQLANPPLRPRKTILAGTYTVHMLRPQGDRVTLVTIQRAAWNRDRFQFYLLPKRWFATDPREFTRSSGFPMRVEISDGRPYIHLQQVLMQVTKDS